MIKNLCTLALMGVTSSFLQGQNFVEGAVVSFKADYYKDFSYDSSNANGIPPNSLTPINLEITGDSWGNNLPASDNYPKNSLTPTEITTGRGTISLNDGAEHDFQAMPIGSTEVKSGKSGGNRGVVSGYGNLTSGDISNLRDGKSPQWFLTSGKHGMDLATAVANINEGLSEADRKIEFGAFIVNKDKVDDGKPDFLFTQVADPGTQSTDQDIIYFIEHKNGQYQRIGKELKVNFNSSAIPDLGGARRDIRYIHGAATKPLKMIAFEFDDFNIKKEDAEKIIGLVYIPSGTSDPAFVAADRNSVFVYKGVSGHIGITGEDITRDGYINKVIQGNSTVEIDLSGFSQNGNGPFELTYEVTDKNGGTQTIIVSTGVSSDKVSLPFNSNKLGTYTYELIKVKDGSGTEKEITDQEVIIKVVAAPICTTLSANGIPGINKVLVSTLKRSGNDLASNNLGAYIALESTTKGFVITRNANPEDNISNPKEGMLVWDTTAKCLKMFSDKKRTKTFQWNCIFKGCNQ